MFLIVNTPVNHKAIYDRLCERAKGRQVDGYVEKHRIIPGCMGGTYAADNVVKLTAEEHFLAHQLLVKIYPDNKKLIFALRFLTVTTKHHVRNNKEFGWIRRLANEARKGQKRSAETKQRMSDAGKLRWKTDDRTYLRKPKSAETKLKMAEAARRRWATTDDETRAAHGIAVMKGQALTQVR